MLGASQRAAVLPGLLRCPFQDAPAPGGEVIRGEAYRAPTPDGAHQQFTELPRGYMPGLQGAVGNAAALAAEPPEQMLASHIGMPQFPGDFDRQIDGCIGS